MFWGFSAGSTNEGLAGGLTSFLDTRCTSNYFFCDCKCKNETVWFVQGVWLLRHYVGFLHSEVQVFFFALNVMFI